MFTSRKSARTFFASAFAWAERVPFFQLARAAAPPCIGYELRKGTVHFPLTKPVPMKLISRIAKLRAAGIAATSKKPVLGREKEGRKPAQ